MHDFVSEFWSWYIIIPTILGIIGCFVLLVKLSGGKIDSDKTAETMGHVWDEDLSLHAVLGSAGKVLSDLRDDVKRLLGLSHENMNIDQMVYDDNNNLISSRVRIYSNRTDADNGTNNNIIATYRFEGNAEGPGTWTLWKQIRIS